jgi:hypothetical protein
LVGGTRSVDDPQRPSPRAAGRSCQNRGYKQRMVRTLDLAQWAGQWVAVDARDTVRASAIELLISFVTSSASNLRASKSCVHPFRVSRLCSALADAWVFWETDFGESHESLGRPEVEAYFEGRAMTFVPAPSPTAPPQALYGEGTSFAAPRLVAAAADLLDNRNLKAPVVQSIIKTSIATPAGSGC